jgi:nucleoside-diphosphate-sugar epimerase
MKVCVTGDKGYIGAKLVPALEALSHEVVGIDWRDKANPRDIRDIGVVKDLLAGCDVVIHLANISNDPSFDLAPQLAESVNWGCFPTLVQYAASAGIKRFIFASSSSVYGVKETANVTEDMPLEPLTDYSKYKAMCEEYLQKNCPRGMEYVIVRPATVCGYSPSMRLDLLVNIFTHHAWQNGVINVHGGHQYRPNIHIDDMVAAYVALLDVPNVDGEIFNVGYKNLTILETAELVCEIVGRHVKINVEESRDPRSYHVNSDKIKRVIGFECCHEIDDAVEDMLAAFELGQIPEPDSDQYYRVRQMKVMSA